MSIAFVNAADGGHTATTTTHSFSYTAGSGANRLLVVGVEGDATNDFVTSAKYNNVNMTLVDKQQSQAGGSARWMYLFYLLNPASGANTVLITASSSCDFILASAADYTGVNQLDSNNKQTTTTPASSATISDTTIADNCWVVLFGNQGAAPSSGTNYTQRTLDGSFGSWCYGDTNAVVTPAGSVSMTVNYGSTTGYGQIVAGFSPFVAVVKPPVQTESFPNPNGYVPAIMLRTWINNNIQFFPVAATIPFPVSFPNPVGRIPFMNTQTFMNSGLSLTSIPVFILMPQIWM